MLAPSVLLWSDWATLELAETRQRKGGYACGERKRELCKLFCHLIGMNYGQLWLTLLGLHGCKMKENT